MTRRITLFLGCAALLAALLTGCGVDKPHSPTVVLTGTDYFERYVAIGSSMTAGFMDGGLMLNGQLGSYPSLVARQMGHSVAVSSSATFTQPYILSPGIGITSTGSTSVTAGVLYWTGTGVALLGTTPTASVPSLAVMATLPAPYSNLAVPLATTSDVLNALTSANSQVPNNRYFDLILRNPTFGNVTMLNQAIGRKPTLVTLWIGAEEILTAATTGSPALGVNLTPAAYFAGWLDQIIEQIQVNVAQLSGTAPLIIAANLPALDDIPYFVPKALVDAIAGATVPTDESPVSYVRLPALSFLAVPDSLPLDGRWTLSTAEAGTVTGLIEAYNANIASVCDERDVPVVDAQALFATLHDEGLDGLTGGLYALGEATTAFSLDGIHPNNRGQGLVANAFVEAINEAAGTSLAGVDVGSLVWDPTYGTGD